MEVLDLASIVAGEKTDFGWRGLTERGEMVEVRALDGAGIPKMPEAVPHSRIIGEYLAHAERALELFTETRRREALKAINDAIRLAPTAYAKYNRAIIELSLGHWREGFADYEARHEIGVHCLKARPGIPRWTGEALAGKRILLTHELGFGDSIAMVRFVPVLRAMGADIHLIMPPELARLASWFAPLATAQDDADYYCPLMSIMNVLKVTPETMPRATYLFPDKDLVAEWRKKLNGAARERVGIAWMIGNLSKGDFPRQAPLALFADALSGSTLYSLQKQGAEEAKRYGVITSEFRDFADVAALASLMDRIVVVDTAAANVAGALGHPGTSIMLSSFHSWRWKPSIYPSARLCTQDKAGDWESAFKKLEGYV